MAVSDTAVLNESVSECSVFPQTGRVMRIRERVGKTEMEKRITPPQPTMWYGAFLYFFSLRRSAYLCVPLPDSRVGECSLRDIRFHLPLGHLSLSLPVYVSV